MPAKWDHRTRVGAAIDFVLVWEESLEEQEPKDTLIPREEQKDKKALCKEKWRKTFLFNLCRAGLRTEEEVTTSAKEKIHYFKISAPFEVLGFYAEELRMLCPLKVCSRVYEPTTLKLLRKLGLPNPFYENVPNQPPNFYMCPFSRARFKRFHGSKNPETFFTATQRQRIVYEVLRRTPYGKGRSDQIGINKLLNRLVFSAAYPLHDCPDILPDLTVPPEQLNSRQILGHYWANWWKWYKYQPVEHIRHYFGERVTFYFVWLGFYTSWLVPASLVGILVFIYGALNVSSDIPVAELCESGDTFKMCPLCDNCEIWSLSIACKLTKLSYLSDHPGTVLYSVFISFWAVLFLEAWKRKSKSLSYHWNSTSMGYEEEPVLPEYAALAPRTGLHEPYLPLKTRFPRIFTAYSVVAMMLTVVLIYLVAIIIYRSIVTVVLFRSEITVLKTQAAMIAGTSGAVVQLILIVIMERVYTGLAVQLTHWETPRTQSQYEDSFSFKVFVFQVVNLYSSSVYVAFFKGRFIGYPGHYGHLMQVRNEECGPGGCLVELTQQLIVIMIGRQILSNITELAVPKLRSYLLRRRTGLTDHSLEQPWEQDFKRDGFDGLLPEYLEMVLQFGFITIFVAAFPLAPLFALINNWMEIRLDARKLLLDVRRPVAEKAHNIGVWFSILEVLAKLSVISNAVLITFSSEFLPRMLYKISHDGDLRGYVNFSLAYAPLDYTDTHNSTACRYRAFLSASGDSTLFSWRLLAMRLGFMVMFEHVVLTVQFLIDWLVPDVPLSVEMRLKQEQHISRNLQGEEPWIPTQKRDDRGVSSSSETEV
ncbi:anoctamin-7-like [Acipenser ruthenus]|uniref:anoctamin-7-like n=1 Tax=Acipenser ruthenus TaxID=7906 RepID=UPI00274147A3|nr:anoctamin-7-like [Acipenser ruthenus]